MYSANIPILNSILNSQLMKIIVFGEDKFSAIGLEAMLAEGHEVPLVIIPAYSTDARLLRKCAESHDVSIYMIESMDDVGIASRIAALQPDLLFLIHFNRIISPAIFSIPKKGAVNIHPSLLPAYRGQTPQQWAIIHGEKEIGVTTHFVDEGVDSGDIICQEKFEIGENVYIAEIQQLLFQNYPQIIKETLRRVANPDFKAIKQNIPNDKIYPKIKSEQCELTLSQSVTEIYNTIRALSFPYSGAPYRHYRFFKAHRLPCEKEEEIRAQYDKIGFYTDTIFGNIFVAKDGILDVEWFDEI